MLAKYFDLMKFQIDLSGSTRVTWGPRGSGSDPKLIFATPDTYLTSFVSEIFWFDEVSDWPQKFCCHPWHVPNNFCYWYMVIWANSQQISESWDFAEMNNKCNISFLTTFIIYIWWFEPVLSNFLVSWDFAETIN